MNVASSPAVQAAIAAVPGQQAPVVDASVQIRVLKKALDAQEAAAAALLASVPPPSPLTMLGTRLDVYA